MSRAPNFMAANFPSRAKRKLNGANVFAIEAGGEWEIVQAQHCGLVAPGECEVAGLLRGRLGSAHAMAAPLRSARASSCSIKSWRASTLARMKGRGSGNRCATPRRRRNAHNRAARFEEFAARGAEALGAGCGRCAMLRAMLRSPGCDARGFGGDSWGAGEPPLGEPAEGDRLDILDGGGSVVPPADTLSSPFIYAAARQTADFGAPPASLRLRIAQLAASGAPGLNTELTIPL